MNFFVAEQVASHPYAICVRWVAPVHLSRLGWESLCFSDFSANSDLSCLELCDPAHILGVICVQRLATSAYKPARLGKSSLLGLSRRSGQTYPLVADRVASHPYAQSPFLKTGTWVPSALIPSISILSEPTIKSTWVVLRFKPAAANSSSVISVPPSKLKA